MRFRRKGIEAESEDTAYYNDDPVEISVAENPAATPLKFGFITFISVLGVALGANLAFNVDSNNRLEYGQGYAVTTKCQSNSVQMLLTPFAGFQNANGSGKFSLDSVLLEQIDNACVGKDFTIKVYSDTATAALTLSETATGVGVYQGFQSFRFWWQDSVTVTSMSSQYTDVELLNDTSDGTDFNSDSTSILITFDPDQVANYADATQVYKITLETNDHTS